MKSAILVTILYALVAGRSWALKSKACDALERPENGYFVGGLCSNAIGSICGISCKIGYQVRGSTVRTCSYTKKSNFQQTNEKPSWSGLETFCDVKKCPKLAFDDQVIYNCTNSQSEFGTTCYFKCPKGYLNTGSSIRHCLAIEIWSGIPAKCKKIENYQDVIQIESFDAKSTTEETTTKKSISYQDLTFQSIIYGHSFKKVALKIDVVDLPASFRIWMRTNYTKNIKLLSYNFKCASVSIYSTKESNLLIKLEPGSFEYNTPKPLKKNEWVQFAFVQTNYTFKVYFDGVPEIDLIEIEDFTRAVDCNSTFDGQNSFRIVDDLSTKESDLYQPFRGEITKAYLVNDEMEDEAILNSLYSCETKYDFANKTVPFDWSRVPVDDYLAEFRRRPSGFCRGCKDPELIKHSFIYYDGTRTGDTRSYSCVEGFETIGVPVSVCMVYGSWNHKAPRCKKIFSETVYNVDQPRSTGKYDNHYYKVPEFMLNVEKD